MIVRHVYRMYTYVEPHTILAVWRYRSARGGADEDGRDRRKNPPGSSFADSRSVSFSSILLKSLALWTSRSTRSSAGSSFAASSVSRLAASATARCATRGPGTPYHRGREEKAVPELSPPSSAYAVQTQCNTKTAFELGMNHVLFLSC